MESLHFKTVRSSRHVGEKNCALHRVHKKTSQKEEGTDSVPLFLFDIDILTANEGKSKKPRDKPGAFCFYSDKGGLFLSDFFLNDSIDYGDGRQVDDVAG